MVNIAVRGNFTVCALALFNDVDKIIQRRLWVYKIWILPTWHW